MAFLLFKNLYCFKRNLLFESCKNIKKFRHTNFATLNKSQTELEETEKIDEPVKYLGSEAAEWKAYQSRSGGADEIPWIQPYVISTSLAIFLIYFCILREENDIDQKLSGNLYDHIEGLEENQLILTYKYNQENGKDNTSVKARLIELGVDIEKV